MKKVIIAVVLFIIPLSVMIFLGTIVWFENSHWIKGNDIVYKALPETQEWLLSQRPFLRDLPPELPHIVTKIAVHNSELKNSPEVLSATTDFRYIILFKSRDIVLCADYTVTLRPNGKPKQIYTESVRALFTEEKPDFDHQHMNAYYGKSLDPDRLDKYFFELAECGDVQEIRDYITKNPMQLMSFSKDADLIQKLMSQPPLSPF